MDLAQWQAWWKRTGGSAINARLMDEWNPIGVDELPDDEYSSYAGGVGRLLREDASVAELVAYLREAQAVIGVEPIDEVDRAVAERLKAWYAAEVRAD